MEKIPVCDYEGSDYQASFWERGGRGYEDACEEIALRRLLPPAPQRRMLELGAGAGRNTPRYGGYDEITLVDYSRTQLEQARARLGDNPRYRYVAADIYYLPFAPALFDAATMIRTLHHMVEPRLALAQVRQCLVPGAIFILEFANKQNLKAVLRYLVKRQSWSPFTPEPVEFAPLNFDFHPATVRAWLQANQFAVERQLTVSHFRFGPFKRLLPVRLLAGLDSLAQLSGDLWQLSPSVFVRSRAVGTPAGDPKSAPEAGEAGEFAFRCPACGHAPLPDTPPLITCPACSCTYPVEGGIYDFRIK
jgi:ubiquinone/menaquinone biosynthesis C-methylase UbiE